MRKSIVIGAGASGMMAAVFAARGGGEVLLIEKEKQAGKKNENIEKGWKNT